MRLIKDIKKKINGFKTTSWGEWQWEAWNELWVRGLKAEKIRNPKGRLKTGHLISEKSPMRWLIDPVGRKILS